MHQRAMISTDLNTGTSYINIDGITGLVVQPKNARQLREAMEALSRDPKLAGQMGAAAYKKYQQLFTATVMGSAYADLYRQVIGREQD